MSNVVVGLGSNLGDRLQNLQFAVDTLRLVPKTRVAAVSRVYETEPVGFTEQPDFLNAAVLLETDLSPKTVLGICLGIEAAAGRRRTIKDGPRILDLDVLLYESVKKPEDRGFRGTTIVLNHVYYAHFLPDGNGVKSDVGLQNWYAHQEFQTYFSKRSQEADPSR